MNKRAFESIFSQEEEANLKELIEKLKDPRYLPTYQEAVRAARYLSTKRGPNGPNEWFNFCHERRFFEIWTREYIDALSQYLVKRAEEMGATEDKPLIILEVGAGDGRLSYFLYQKLSQLCGGKIKIFATDSGKWGIKCLFPEDEFTVELMDYKTALEKYKPQIVICSWMPYQEDWTADFRKTDSVEEYILIGETDGGCCGHEWLTWGYSSDWLFFEESEDKGKEIIPPYKADGFERVNLNDLYQYQLCRTDFVDSFGNSRTVSFRREK